MPSQPRATCSDCQAVATYAAIPVASGWAGECWELYDSGGNACKESPIPTPGSECRESKHACKKVAHDIAIRCPDNRCRVGSPGPLFSDGWTRLLEERRDVVVTRAGSFTMDVEFKPRSGGPPRVEHVPVTARTPDGANARCLYDGSDIAIELLTAGDVLAGDYTELSVTLVGSGRCTRTPVDPAGTTKNAYHCPAAVKSSSVEIRQPDFSTTVAVTCS